MSEFFHPDNVKLFMGDKTGRVGRLGQILSEHSEGVLLFDEIEKAHRSIWDLFLQMIDAARITLADSKYARRTPHEKDDSEIRRSRCRGCTEARGQFSGL